MNTLDKRCEALLVDAQASLDGGNPAVACGQLIAAVDALRERVSQTGQQSLSPGDAGHPMAAPLGRDPGSES